MKGLGIIFCDEAGKIHGPRNWEMAPKNPDVLSPLGSDRYRLIAGKSPVSVPGDGHLRRSKHQSQPYHTAGQSGAFQQNIWGATEGKRVGRLWNCLRARTIPPHPGGGGSPATGKHAMHHFKRHWPRGGLFGTHLKLTCVGGADWTPPPPKLQNISGPAVVKEDLKDHHLCGAAGDLESGCRPTCV